MLRLLTVIWYLKTYEELYAKKILNETNMTKTAVFGTHEYDNYCHGLPWGN